MYAETADYIEDCRSGLRTYTNDFSGDIGSRFSRVDARLERALEAIEEDAGVEEVREALGKAEDDLETVRNACFTGMSPGNLSNYVEDPLMDAKDAISES